jgi:hypothetical protein
VALELPAAARYRRPERAPDGWPFCPECHETGWRWRVGSRWAAWVGPCHCGRVVGPPPCGWSTMPEPPPDPGSFLDPLPEPPSAHTPHPIAVRHPYRRDATGKRPFGEPEPYYPVCGCGWVGRPSQAERAGWDQAWAHAHVDWRSVPVQPEPRARRRPRRRRSDPPPATLPADYRGPIPCHFGLADNLGCGRGHRADQRDGVTTRHPCRGVIPPMSGPVATSGEVCVCACHLVDDPDTLPRRCPSCGALLPAVWPVYQPCAACADPAVAAPRAARHRR